MKFLHACQLGFLAGVGLVGNSPAQTKPVAPASPEAAAEWALTLPVNGRSQALHGIINGWAESDPAAAAEWSRKLPDQEKYVMNSALAVWGRKDPAAASAWALEMPEGPQKIQALEQVGQSWGSKNRAEAMAWAGKLQTETDRKAALGGVVQSWAMQDSAAALKFAEEQNDVKIKDHLLGKVIYGWCFQDRPRAEKWVEELPEGELKKSMQKAIASAPVRRRVVPVPPTGSGESQKKVRLNFETPPELAKILESPVNQARQDEILRYALDWFRKDKTKATQWVSAKLDGYVLGVTAGILAREWSAKDLPAAAEWIRQIPPFFRDFVARMGAEWAAERPEEIANIVLKWPEDPRRHVVIRGVCEAWAQKDPAATLSWIQALPTGATRSDALKGLVIGWSQSAPAECRAWVEKITDKNEKKIGTHYIIHGLARSQPSEAIAYLQQVPDGESDLNLIYCLGKEWALKNPAAAGEWAKSLPLGPKQEGALQAVLRQWAYADAVRSADWAKNIPEKQSRLLALGAVMEKWVEQNPQEALAWAQRVEDSERRTETLTLAVKRWGQLDSQEAFDWVNKLSDAKQKTALLGELNPSQPAIRRRVGGVCGMAGEEKVKVGQEAPLFAAKTVDGKDLKLADFKGKFVLLDFWATWCGPCLGETPHLKAVFEKYGKREDFALIGLSLDKDPAKPAAYAKENGCGWVDGFLGDWGKDEVTKLYGVRGIPSIWLIGPDGKVVANELRGEAIMAAVSEALEGKK